MKNQFFSAIHSFLTFTVLFLCCFFCSQPLAAQPGIEWQNTMAKAGIMISPDHQQVSADALQDGSVSGFRNNSIENDAIIFYLDEGTHSVNQLQGSDPAAISVLNTYYRDHDHDGYGNPDEYIVASSPPAGYVANNADCEDYDSSIHPGAGENCSGSYLPRIVPHKHQLLYIPVPVKTTVVVISTVMDSLVPMILMWIYQDV